MNENKQSLEEILFDLAVQKTSAAERAAFLGNVCRDNPALRAGLEELLEGHFGGAGFLPKPVAGDPLPLAGLPDAASEDREPRPPATTMKLDLADAPDEAVGQTIGRYKILERVGEGGCGVVYVAEQTEPVRRRVALKVIKLGMDTKAGRRAVRGRAAGAGDDGSSQHRQGAGRGHDRDGPALFRDGTGARHPHHRLLRPEPISPPRNGSICSSRSARPSSTRTRRASSIATSSRRTSWSRCTTACRCPR